VRAIPSFSGLRLKDDLVELFEYIAEHGSPEVAARYTDAIVA
jgi:plasmid stabilization system protein ParE